MCIEPLEDRVAPAAVIALTLTGTSLKIGLSSGTDLVTNIDSGGVFNVMGAPGNTFTLNGRPFQTTGSGLPTAALTGHHIGAVSIADSNAFDNNIIDIQGPILGNLSINLAGPLNEITFETPKIQGALSVKTPAGGTSIGFLDVPGDHTTIGGPVKLALGTGTNQTIISVSRLEIDGGLTVTGGPTKADVTQPGSNFFLVTNTASVEIAGGLSFSSKFAPSTFLINTANLEVGGNISVVTTGTAEDLPDEINDRSTNIGGNLSITANSSSTLEISGTLMNVNGKVTLVQGGSGAVSFVTSGPTSIGALAAVGHGGLFNLQGSVEPTDVSGLVSDGAVLISGGMRISNFASAEIEAVGAIGGSVSVTGGNLVIFNDSLSSLNGHLAIGGSLTVTAPPSPTTGTATSNPFEIADVVVGGSLTVNGNNGGEQVELVDTGIFGSAAFNFGTKIGSTTAQIVVEESIGDHQSFFANGFTANMPGTGGVIFSDANSTPDLMVFGQATIAAPAGANLTNTLPTAFFALPVTFTTSK